MSHNLDLLMHPDNDDLISNTLEATDNPKRKSPFVQLDQAVGSDGSETEPVDGQVSPKQQRKYSFDAGLPPLLPFESEFVVDVESMMEEARSLASADGLNRSVRVERESSHIVSISNELSFQLVCHLVPRQSSVFDIGVFLRLFPTNDYTDSSDVRYSCSYVSIQVMVVNVESPYSGRSMVSRDVCTYTSEDSCRGWQSMLSFDTLDTLRENGFLLGMSNKILLRGQVLRDSLLSEYSVKGSGHDLPDLVGYKGLRNFGATCYLNGLLQSLFHIDHFREIVYTAGSRTDSITSALQIVFCDLETSAKPVVAVDPLVKAFGWDIRDLSVQHDAQEMNRLLIDKIESELGGTADSSEDPIGALFSGEIENYIECLDVDYRSTRVEKFYDIPLYVRDLSEGSAQIGSLSEALSRYLHPELLEGSNLYDAEQYGKQRAKKGVRFLKLPPVLTFQIMRFQFDMETGEMGKVNSRFEFPPELDMEQFATSEETKIAKSIYRLHSVLVHSGDVNAGHYYAYVNLNGVWHKFDDDQVTRTTERAAVEENFGGPPEEPVNRCVDYLTGEDSGDSEGSETSGSNKSPDRRFSAYMLTYIRKDGEDEGPVGKFVNLPEPLQQAIYRKRADASLSSSPFSRRSASAEVYSLSCVDLSKEASFLSTPFVGDWLSVDAKNSTLQETLNEMDQEVSGGSHDDSDPLNPIYLFDYAAYRFVRCLGRLGLLEELQKRVQWYRHSQCPVLLWKQRESGVGQSNLFCVEIDGGLTGQLAFSRGTACNQLAAQKVWKFDPDSCQLLEPADFANSAYNACIYLYCSTSLEETFVSRLLKEMVNSITISVVVHDAYRLLDSEEPEEIALSLTLSDEISILRDRTLERISRWESRQLWVFRENPFSAPSAVPVHAGSIGDLFGEDLCWKLKLFRGYFSAALLHYVAVPIVAFGHLVCVRYFSPQVVEEGCGLVWVESGSSSIFDLINLARSEMIIESDRPLRLLEIEAHEIVEVFREQESRVIAVNTLNCWDSANPFANYVRIERDNPRETVRCYHYDVGTRQNVGHPFLLEITDGGPFPTDPKQAVCDKLQVACPKSWIVSMDTNDATQKVLEISHVPATSASTPRLPEKQLSISRR